MKKVWCGFFTASTAAVAAAAFGAYEAGAYCKARFSEAVLATFEGNFHITSMNLTAALGPGPALPVRMENMSIPAGQFLTPQFVNDISRYSEYAEFACWSGTGALSLSLLVGVLGLTGMYLYNREKFQNIDAVVSGQNDLDDDNYIPETPSYRLLNQ